MICRFRVSVFCVLFICQIFFYKNVVLVDVIRIGYSSSINCYSVRTPFSEIETMMYCS